MAGLVDFTFRIKFFKKSVLHNLSGNLLIIMIQSITVTRRKSEKFIELMYYSELFTFRKFGCRCLPTHIQVYTTK